MTIDINSLPEISIVPLKIPCSPMLADTKVITHDGRTTVGRFSPVSDGASVKMEALS